MIQIENIVVDWAKTNRFIHTFKSYLFCLFADIIIDGYDWDYRQRYTTDGVLYTTGATENINV